MCVRASSFKKMNKLQIVAVIKFQLPSISWPISYKVDLKALSSVYAKIQEAPFQVKHRTALNYKLSVALSSAGAVINIEVNSHGK